MSDFELSADNYAPSEPQTFGNALRERGKTANDFAAACGIRVERARRLLRGGFIPNTLDLVAIAQLLDYDARTVIALRERHNQHYQRLKDRGTVWSLSRYDITAPTAASSSPAVNAVEPASDILGNVEDYDFEQPDFSVEPCNVVEAKFRWIYLGCADRFTIDTLEDDLHCLKKPIASDLAAALDDLEVWRAECTARLEREQLEIARAAFAAYPST